MRIAFRVPRRRAEEAGFTLMEMLIVLVIMGMIAAVAIPQVMKLLGSAKHKAAKIQIETLIHSLQIYEIDNGEFPTTEQGLAALWSAPANASDWNGPYVRREKQIIDPWGHKMVYAAPGQKRRYDLKSLGADNQEGGSGDDADVVAD